jgi:hypothetical protein
MWMRLVCATNQSTDAVQTAGLLHTPSNEGPIQMVAPQRCTQRRGLRLLWSEQGVDWVVDQETAFTWMGRYC